MTATTLPRSTAEQIAASHAAAVDTLPPIAGVPALHRCYDTRDGVFHGVLDGSQDAAVVERLVVIADSWKPTPKEVGEVQIDHAGRVVRQPVRRAPVSEPAVPPVSAPIGPLRPLAADVVAAITRRHNLRASVQAGVGDGLPRPSGVSFAPLHLAYAATTGDCVGAAEDPDVRQHLDRCIVLADDEAVTPDQLAALRVRADGVVVEEEPCPAVPV